MGLIWSMEPADQPTDELGPGQPASEPGHEPGQPADPLAPVQLCLAAEVAGQRVAAGSVKRLRIPDGLSKTGRPVALRLAFEPGPGYSDLLPAATIPVERITGTVLLITCGDDQMSCPAFHDIPAQRLADAGHHAWEHIVYPGAGHGIVAPPYGPTAVELLPGPGVTFTIGGTPAADASGRAGAWVQVLRFLATHLAA